MIRTIPTFTQHGGVHCLSKTGNAVQIASLGRVESWRLTFTGASRETKTKNPRRIPIARPLLAHGAEVNAKDEHRATPMRLLLGYQYIGYPDQRDKIIELLKRHGAKE